MTVCPALKGVRIPTPAGWGGVMSLMVSIARPEKQEAALMPGLPTRGVKTCQKEKILRRRMRFPRVKCPSPSQLQLPLPGSPSRRGRRGRGEAAGAKRKGY